MLYPSLGRSGLRVSRLILGTAGFGELVAPEDVQRLVDSAIDNGISTFDTADSYGAGQSEILLGKALSGRRNRAVICTKVGFRVGDNEADHSAYLKGAMDDDQRWSRGIGPNERGLSRSHIIDAVDASLRRLGCDYIDLCQLHFWDRHVPIEETLRAMEEVSRSGKVRYWGASQFAGWQLVKATAVAEREGCPRFASVQLPLNLLSRAAELEAMPAAVHEQISVLAFQCYAAGMLSGRYTSAEPPDEKTRLGSRQTYRDRYWDAATFERVQRFRSLAGELGRDMGALALGWVLSRPGIGAVIAGIDAASDVPTAAHAAAEPLSPEVLEAVDRRTL